MMTRLVGRLPFMVGPRWMRSLSQAVALEDVVTLLRYALDHPELAGEAYDVGCPDVLSYADMLRLTGDVLGRRTRVLTLPVRTARLSLLWVSVITGASRELVRPLLESLRHDLVARDGLRLQHLAGLATVPLRPAIERALATTKSVARSLARKRSGAKRARGESRVRSVQRLPLPAGCDARWVATEYSRWLPKFMAPFLRVDIDATKSCTFRFWPLPWPLLVLTFAAERSASDRQLFFVTGGFLARQVDAAGPGSSARLEFRSVLGGRFVLAAIHDFVPRLPWFLYTFTQALVHLLVMRRFARHLARMAGRNAAMCCPVSCDPEAVPRYDGRRRPRGQTMKSAKVKPSSAGGTLDRSAGSYGAKLSKRTAAVKAWIEAKPGAEGTAFTPPNGTTPLSVIYKVRGKMFAILALRGVEDVILKCDPELASALREEHAGIGHRSHLDRRFWISVRLDADVPTKQVRRLVSLSYDLVCANLTAKQRAELARLTKAGSVKETD